ncbi:hypothetical protein TWF481_000313 [Arthrobotrys musiformis]|uniref:Apple domain-containing protein n=1 Tax=Arthrobotrys musiformis TaxID=47236 RepID=A0AAV9WNG6_9PEZI
MRFGVLSVVALQVLSGCIDGAFALNCKPAAKSCAASARQAAPCTSLFLKNKVKRPTCTIVPAPVTVTKKVTPAASTKLITITTTVSTTTTKSLPTKTITKTEETVVTETSLTTVTTSTTEVAETTTTFVKTVTTRATKWEWTCTNPGGRKRNALPTANVEFDGFAKRTVLPKCCGCFLTSTKTAARQTKTITKTLPKPTVTKKVTKTVTATIIKTAIPSSSTVYETTTELITTTSTEIETHTETTTETVQATQTDTFDPCEAPNPYIGRNAFSFIGTTVEDGGPGADTFIKCCEACFDTLNCASYMFDTTSKSCEIHKITSTTTVDTKCGSDSCTFGRPSGTFIDSPTNELYALGPCSGAVSRI